MSSRTDGFDAWAAEHGLPATVQIEGDEVVDATSPDLAYCDRGHPAHFAANGCGPCADEDAASADRWQRIVTNPTKRERDAFRAWARDRVSPLLDPAGVPLREAVDR
jgi:hypothetical protein